MSKNTIVIGLGFGDEAKGSITDYLAQRDDVRNVVRFSGGPQAAHRVENEYGAHTFSNFGSGTLRGCRTIISEYMMVNPFNMAGEANALWDITNEDPFNTTIISESSLLITPLHVAANQKREINRGAAAHGSCGLGVGETRGFAIKHPFIALKVGDLRIKGLLEAKLQLLREYLEKELGELDAPSNTEILGGYEALLDDRNFQIVSDSYIYKELHIGKNVFEGSQGVLLDESKGFHPHTTWSSTGSQNAQRILHAAKLPTGKVLGLTRSYTTRHGNGPFPSEFKDNDWVERFPENHNTYGQFQGSWRVGPLDLVLLNYAVQANGGVDEIAVSHLDYDYDQVVTSYDNGDTISLPVSPVRDLKYQEELTRKLSNPHMVKDYSHVNTEDELLSFIEFATGAPVTVKSYGNKNTDKISV